MRNFTILACLFAGTVAAQTLPESIARGKVVYEANCQHCHGANGLGSPTQGIKPLDASPIVRAHPWYEIRVVLDGVPGNVPPMGSWASRMSDADMAAVITYTKNAWSNTTGQLVLAADIAAARIPPPQPVPTVWPAPIGTGTALQVATINPDAGDENKAFKTSKCVAWWYSPDATQPGGWRAYNVWLDKPWYAPCKLTVIPAGLSAAALASIWTSVEPRSLTDAGETWAAAIWWQDFGKPGMPETTWVTIATEGQAFRSSLMVRYGTGNTWVQKLGAGDGQCTNTYFGSDPAFGLAKVCQVSAVPHVVAPYSTALSRTTYPVVNGVRSTKGNGSVLVLTAGKPTPVDCLAARIAEGLNLYCGVVGRAGTVAPSKVAP